MRTLILSCNTGEGHNACARAIKEYFEIHGESCVIEDSLRFVSEKMSRFISGWHIRLYRHLPGAFGLGYGFVERHPGYIEDGSAFYKVLNSGAERLYEYIVAHGIDTIVCTHVFAALLVTGMMKKYPVGDLKTAMVYTDYTCFPGTAGTDMDYYFMPHSSLAPVFKGVGIGEERLVVAGIPVMQRFFQHMSKAEAKSAVGIDPQKRHILMMGGSMGCGPVEETAVALASQMPQNCELTVVCGTNKKIQEKLEKAVGAQNNVHICGYTDKVPVLLDSADLFFTKPGGISTSEASKKSVPMVLIQAVEGCETHNYRFFVGQGMAVLSHDPQQLAQLGIEIIGDDTRLKAMTDAYSDELRCNGAEIIYNTIKK